MKISIFPSQTVIRNRPDGGAVAAPFQPLYQRIKTIVLRRFQEGERRPSQGGSERDSAWGAQSGESGHGTQGGRKTDAGYLLVTEPTPLCGPSCPHGLRPVGPVSAAHLPDGPSQLCKQSEQMLVNAICAAQYSALEVGIISATRGVRTVRAGSPVVAVTCLI